MMNNKFLTIAMLVIAVIAMTGYTTAAVAVAPVTVNAHGQYYGVDTYTGPTGHAVAFTSFVPQSFTVNGKAVTPIYNKNKVLTGFVGITSFVVVNDVDKAAHTFTQPNPSNQNIIFVNGKPDHIVTENGTTAPFDTYEWNLPAGGK